jgi:hypothetical protein
MIQITVNEVNVAPVLAAIGDQSVDELVALTFTALTTDTDLPANTLTFSLDAGAPGGASTYTAPGLLRPQAYTITWDFGDGVTSTGTLTPTHTYADDGDYTVTLAVDDGNGGVGTDAWPLL